MSSLHSIHHVRAITSTAWGYASTGAAGLARAFFTLILHRLGGTDRTGRPVGRKAWLWGYGHRGLKTAVDDMTTCTISSLASRIHTLAPPASLCPCRCFTVAVFLDRERCMNTREVTGCCRVPLRCLYYASCAFLPSNRPLASSDLIGKSQGRIRGILAEVVLAAASQHVIPTKGGFTRLFLCLWLRILGRRVALTSCLYVFVSRRDNGGKHMCCYFIFHSHISELAASHRLCALTLTPWQIASRGIRVARIS